MILWRPTFMARILVGAACVRDISAVRELFWEFLSYEINQNRKRASGQTRLLYSRVLLAKVKNVGARWVASQGQKGDLRVATGTKGTRGTQGRFGALDTPATILVK